MGIAERKEREKQQRRLEIIAAAENVFFTKGIDNSTMEDVANKVELSKGTLYLYFKGKNELLMEIVQTAIKKLHDLFVEYSSREKDGISKIKAIGEAFIYFFFNFNDYYKMLIYHFHNQSSDEECEICNIINTLKIGNHQIMVKILEDGIKDGSIRKDIDPVKTSFLLWGETMGILQLIDTRSSFLGKLEKIKKDEFINYFFEFTYNALKA